jgi:hypothetical protein
MDRASLQQVPLSASSPRGRDRVLAPSEAEPVRFGDQLLARDNPGPTLEFAVLCIVISFGAIVLGVIGMITMAAK